ncbi:unnamed protein product, partial [Porites evermanni]
MTTTEKRANRKKPPNGTNDPSNPRRTSSFVTDFTAKDTGRLGTDFFTTTQGGTLLKPTEGIKPVKEDNNLPGKTPIPENGEQPNSTEVSSTVQYATVTEPTKKKTILLHVIPVKISSSDVKSITTYGLIDNGS